MGIAEYFIQNKLISWIFVALLLVGGAVSFTKLGQLEFPEFPIPRAMVNTLYPGASPEQVEEEVTLPVERAIQQLEYIKNITSESSAGISQVTIELKSDINSSHFPQIWDELRRKIHDVQSSLPPGVRPSIVNDDFSDVYGILYSISGKDYNYRELQEYVNVLRRELTIIPGVKKVTIAGKVSQQVVIELSQAKLASLGVDPSIIYGLIKNQNVVSNAGKMIINGQSIRIDPTGEFKDIKELERLIINVPGHSQLVHLGDIAHIYETFDDTPMNVYHSNSENALSLGISFAHGVNVVNVGKSIEKRMQELESARPVGMELSTVYNQSAVVSDSVNSFLISLLESIAIVIVILLIAMGVRSGLLMGGILLLTIAGTFIGMHLLGISLHLISLGALIIALGMLVDNAIVITEGVLVGMQRGMNRLDAINLIVRQSIWPLLGATIIAILAFAPIGLSPDNVGEFLNSLFKVLLVSLGVSWIIAITLTPFFSCLVFKDPKEAMVGNESDPYKGIFFTTYKGLLMLALRHRITSIALTILAMVIAIVGFGNVKQAFFPPSNTPIFFVDVWGQEGTDIRQTQKNMASLEKEILSFKEVENVTTTIGMGAQRFVLPYSPAKFSSSYGQFIIRVDSLDTLQKLLPDIEQRMESTHPEYQYNFKLLDNGPAPLAKIEARFYGSDPVVLRQLSMKAKSIMENTPGAVSVRDNWRNTVVVVRPQVDEAAARRSGISKQALDDALLVNFSGKQIGLYRDGSFLLPIIARAPTNERLNADRLSDLQVWSQERQAFVPISLVVKGFKTVTENPRIVRRNLKRVVSVLADIAPFTNDTADSVRVKMKDKIEAIPLPAGYSLEWGGEYETARDAQASMFTSIPMGYLAMFLITVFLFGTLRQAFAIWFTVPLSIIGIALGLLLFNAPFTFTALLGMLSLSGMLVKNGIVLVEQINIESKKNVTLQQAIVDACVSRMRPVLMAALTTMLGMIPLLRDAFFESMAVTIIFGLGFATILTLVVLPVIYSLLYRVRHDTPTQN